MGSFIIANRELSRYCWQLAYHHLLLHIDDLDPARSLCQNYSVNCQQTFSVVEICIRRSLFYCFRVPILAVLPKALEFVLVLRNGVKFGDSQWRGNIVRIESVGSRLHYMDIPYS